MGNRQTAELMPPHVTFMIITVACLSVLGVPELVLALLSFHPGPPPLASIIALACSKQEIGLRYIMQAESPLMALI